jgi:hypothetical protein
MRTENGVRSERKLLSPHITIVCQNANFMQLLLSL